MNAVMQKKSPKQLYHKLFYRYSLIIICIVAVLILYFLSSTRTRIVDTNLDYTKMMEEKAADYVRQCAETVRNINSDLFQSPQAQEDLLKYFILNEEDYQKFRLDKYMSTDSLSYDGFNEFLEKIWQSYPLITYVEIFSYDVQKMRVFNSDGKSYLKSVSEEEKKDIEEGNLSRKGEFAFLKEIRDPYSMRSMGCMIVNFSAAEFEEIQKYYSKAELAVTNDKDIIIYSSEPELKINELNKRSVSAGKVYASEYFTQSDKNGYRIYTMLDKGTAGHIPFSLLITILLIGAGLIFMGELFVDAHLKKLAGRLDYILGGMKSVMTGDLRVRLNADKNGDELDVISDNFNEMCMQLERYIEKSYLAEIEQRNAEIEVLQNQINPHFLYNTLEAIRMKAICNGDREVGKMLYGMAVIFRSQLKEADVITVIQELHYCKKYLELFEFRYQGKFTSRVACPEELMDYPIIKFILQPVIENYFVHGIRGEAEGNEIEIRVSAKWDELIIHAVDNGQGMDEEQMIKKNEELKENRHDGRQSVGLTNVNRRIKAVYGDYYGVVLHHSETGGMHIELHIPCQKRGGSDEKSDAGGR